MAWWTWNGSRWNWPTNVPASSASWPRTTRPASSSRGARSIQFVRPRGVGFLKIPHRKSITPLLHGGKQEGGRRAGTENVAIIAAMMAALEVREKQISHTQHLLRGVWRDNFERELLRTLPGTSIIGANVPRLWNTVSALMPEGDRRHQWVIRLDKAGFAVSTGSACTTGK